MENQKKIIARAKAYKSFFSSNDGKKVFADLFRFCRGDQPTANVDNPNVTYLLEGRREVLLRIIHHADLDWDDVKNIKENYSE